MVICLERGVDLHMAQLMPLSLVSVKSRLVLPFWYRLTRVVMENGPLTGCVYVCTLCPKKVSPLNILQQPPQTCTDLNEILRTQDDIYFCHRRQISQESLIPFTRCSILSNW